MGIKTYSLLPALSLLVSACAPKGHIDEIRLTSFPETVELTGATVAFDTIQGSIGVVQLVDSSYYCWMYGSDNFIMKTDRDFNIRNFTCRKGEGSGEVTGISATYGDILADGSPGVVDPYRYLLYRIDEDRNDSLSVVGDFGVLIDRILPRDILQITDTEYVIVPATYDYGLVSYSEGSDSLIRWPLGYDFGPVETPVQYITAMRAVDLNRKRGVIGEIYGGLPLLILHDMSGKVFRRITYGPVPEISSLNAASNDPFTDIKLTDNHIYILYRESPDADSSHILVTDYDGNPVVRLIVAPTYTFEIDPDKRRIICVTPRPEEGNLTVYPIPDIITQP